MKTEWNLKYFYTGLDDEKYSQSIKNYEKSSRSFIRKYKGNIASLDEDDFYTFLQDYSNLGKHIYPVLQFVELNAALDTQNSVWQKESSRLEKILIDISEKLLFVMEEEKKIGAKELLRLSKKKKFKEFENYLYGIASSIRHYLTEDQEKIDLKLSSVISNYCSLYGELSNSFEFEFNGEKVTESEILALRESSDRETRKAAFETLYSVYGNKQNQITFGQIYSAICKENIVDVELRKYDTVMSVRNGEEELGDDTVDYLLKTISENFHLYHKFLKLKAKLLGLEKLEIYDMFAPLPSKRKKKKITFEQGWKKYCNVIGKVDKKLLDFSNKMLHNGFISVYPYKGKTGGAFASYSKFHHPFVLLNWTYTESDIATLAHELGHAFHGHLSQKQNYLVYDTPLSTAETASIFNEMVYFESMIEELENQDEINEHIMNRLDDIFATIFRQVMYVNFERRCHESFKQNIPLTYEDFNKIWLEEFKRLVGKNVNVPSYIASGWSVISHVFYTPFYCFAYAIGNLNTFNIYQCYKDSKNKKEFIEKYHNMLSAGGSSSPEELVKDNFGIEFNKKFYDTSFKLINDLMKKIKVKELA